jgi:hypothetical protein
MMRETGRRLLGIGARARFAAYSLFEKKSSDDSNSTPGTGKYILKSPDGALEVTVSGGRLTYSAAVGGITVIKPSEIGLLIQGGRNIGSASRKLSPAKRPTATSTPRRILPTGT